MDEKHLQRRARAATTAARAGKRDPRAGVDGEASLCRGDLVVMARCQTPDPIPNSAVKSLSADGTAS